MPPAHSSRVQCAYVPSPLAAGAELPSRPSGAILVTVRALSVVRVPIQAPGGVSRTTRGVFAGESVTRPAPGVKGRGELVEPDQRPAAPVANRGRSAEEDGPDRPGAEAEADRQLGRREGNSGWGRRSPGRR